MTEPITVGFAALQTLTDQLRRTLKHMIDQLEDLYDAMVPVLRTWEGEAREAWLDRMDEWDKAMQGLQESYDWCHHIVENGQRNYEAAHTAVLRGWGAA